MKSSNVGMFARRVSGRLTPKSTLLRGSWAAIVAGLFAVSLATIVGIKLDARTGGSPDDMRASLNRESSAMALSEQWTNAYNFGPSLLSYSAIDTQGTPYLLGGVRTIPLINQGRSIVSKHIEGRFTLVDPGSFVEFNFVGDSNGRYILRLANRIVSLYFAVMGKDRVEISTLNLRQPVSGSSISVEANGQCSISSESWRLIVSGCFDVKGVSSYSTNLLPDEILKLDYLTGAKK